ncbi:putative transcriptional regulator [Providencia alcalifaciens]|nr:putative transcriptional regulator [Providencia alcalifaciens]
MKDSNKNKKSEKVQLRTTEYLKNQVSKLANEDGISKNSIINQAIAWYVEEREKRAA